MKAIKNRIINAWPIFVCAAIGYFIDGPFLHKMSSQFWLGICLGAFAASSPLHPRLLEAAHDVYAALCSLFNDYTLQKRWLDGAKELTRPPFEFNYNLEVVNETKAALEKYQEGFKLSH